MSEVQRTAPPTEMSAERKVSRPGEGAHAKKALELVAMRGREVIGVRHLLVGGTAWIGDVREALARVPTHEIGGKPMVVSAVTRDEYLLYVPARARARMHGASGVPRLLVGPHKLALSPGERAVLVLGQIQIRARIVDVEGILQQHASSGGIAGWVALVVSLYIAALSICAALAPAEVPRLERGAMQRLQSSLLHRTDAR